MRTLRSFCYSLVLAITFLIPQYGLTQIWAEDWEGDWTNYWHASQGVWQVGAPTSGPGSALNSQNCLATNLSGNYPSNTNTRFIRDIPFTVPAASENPRLRFWHWFSNSDDQGWVEIKVVNSSEWIRISEIFDNTGSNVWTSPSIDLSLWAGIEVQLAFFFDSGNNGFVSSGWYIDDIEIDKGPIIFDNPETWENGLVDWSSDNGTWQVGTPVSGPQSAFSGQNCAATRLDGNYHSVVNSRLRSPIFTIPAASENPRLRFWHWYSNSDDQCWVEIKIEGSSDWEQISDPFPNSSPVWTFFSLNLSSWADSTVQIAFRIISGGNGFVSSGWYIDEIEISELSLPLSVSAGADVSICEGDSVVLDGIASGGSGPYTYSWSPATGLNSAAIPNPIASPVSTTTYTLTVTDTKGSTSTDLVQVAVATIPPTPSILLINSNTLQCSVIGDNYQWFLDDVPLPINSRSIEPDTSGNYRVIVTDNNCDSEISPLFNFMMVGIENALQAKSIRIFPNPTSGILFLEAEWEQPVVLDLAIMDITGKVREAWQSGSVRQILLPIDMSAYPEGVYLLRIKLKYHVVFKKILLAKN